MPSANIYIYQDKSNNNLRIKVKPYLQSETYRLSQFTFIKVYEISRESERLNATKALRDTFGETLAKIKPTIANCDKIDEICNPMSVFVKTETKLKDLVKVAVHTPPGSAKTAPHSTIDLRVQPTYHPVYVHRVMRFKRRMDYLIDTMTEDEQKANANISIWLAVKPLAHTKPKVGSPIRSKVLYTIYFTSKEQQLELIRQVNGLPDFESARNLPYTPEAIKIVRSITEAIKGHPEPEMDVENLII